MARENQAIQAALIIFVVLTVVLGTTAFVFFRRADDALGRMAAAQDEATALRARVKAVLDQSSRIRAAELAQKTAELASLQLLLELREQSKEPQAAQDRQAAEQAHKDAASAERAAATDRRGVEVRQEGLAGQLADAREKSDGALDAAKSRIGVLQEQQAALEQKSRALQRRLDDAMGNGPRRADGQIRWVSQRTGTAWINLGRGDGLAPQLEMDVWPAGAAKDSHKPPVKGKIVVTQILGEHLAEARVRGADPRNPLLPGDEVYSATWNAAPNEARIP